VADILIYMKDGTKKEFLYKGRGGGSWNNSVKYKESFAVIEDEWGNQTAIPSADIKEIEIRSGRSW
jgi:hypothetical protein